MLKNILKLFSHGQLKSPILPPTRILIYQDVNSGWNEMHSLMKWPTYTSKPIYTYMSQIAHVPAQRQYLTETSMYNATWVHYDSLQNIGKAGLKP